MCIRPRSTIYHSVQLPPISTRTTQLQAGGLRSIKAMVSSTKLAFLSQRWSKQWPQQWLSGGHKHTTSIQGHSKTATIIVPKFASTTKRIAAKKRLTLVADFLDDILQCTYENAGTAVWPVVYSIVEQVLFDSFRRDVISKSLPKHLSTYFSTSKAINK